MPSPEYEHKPPCGLNPEMMVSPPPLLCLVEERGSCLWTV